MWFLKIYKTSRYNSFRCRFSLWGANRPFCHCEERSDFVFSVIASLNALAFRRGNLFFNICIWFRWCVDSVRKKSRGLPLGALAMTSPRCHCEERSDEAISKIDCHARLRQARNDKKVDCLGFLLESLAMTDHSLSLRGAKWVRDLVYDFK